METLKFTAGDGIDIAYHRFPAAAVDASFADVPVVLQHGFAASSHTNWVLPGVVAALQASGRTVIAVDARGHGKSDTPHDPSFYGEHRMATDLTELFQHLGLDRLDLAGYSMGGIISLVTATREPRVRRLVVGGIGGTVTELDRPERRAFDPNAIVAAMRADDPSTITDPAARGFRLFADSQGSDRFALAAHAQAIHRSAIPFDAITAERSLVLVGRDDALAVRPEALAAAIPRGELRVVDGDHLTALATPEFTPALVEFVNRD